MGLVSSPSHFLDSQISDHIFLSSGLSVTSDVSSVAKLLDLIQGKIVVANEECGYWNCDTALASGYSNPFLVKLSRKIAEIEPACLLCGSAYWGRSQHILQCGIVPFCDDLLKSLCLLNGTDLNKSGFVERTYEFSVKIIS